MDTFGKRGAMPPSPLRFRRHCNQAYSVVNLLDEIQRTHLIRDTGAYLEMWKVAQVYLEQKYFYVRPGKLPSSY